MRRVWEQQEELVAREPAEQVPFANRAAAPLDDTLEHVVADEVAEPVVDVLEPVHVDEHDRDLVVGREQDLAVRVQSAAVRDSGERVAVRLGALRVHLGLEERDEVEDPAGSLPDRAMSGRESGQDGATSSDTNAENPSIADS